MFIFEIISITFFFIVAVVCFGYCLVSDWQEKLHEQQVRRIEADLDQAQEELRQAVLTLAEQLAADRDEASRALTRAAYLSSGKTFSND